MSYDDPSKVVRDLNREFERMRDLTRSPLERMNDIFDQHRLRSQLPQIEFRQVLQGSSAYRPIAQELMDISTVTKLDNSLFDVAAFSRQQLQLVDTWQSYQHFYGGLPSVGLDESYFEASGLNRALSSVRDLSQHYANPIRGLQEAIKNQLDEIESFNQSLPIVHLEEKLALLASAVSIPEVSTELGKLRVDLDSLMPAKLPTHDLFSRLRSLSVDLGLHHLDTAASQWASMFPAVSTKDLISEPLLQGAISVIQTATRYRERDDLNGVLSYWESLVAQEQAKHEGGELPAWVQGFLLNLLFFVLSLISQCEAESRIKDKLEALERNQVAIVETIEATAQAENELAAEAHENQERELAAIRQQIESLVEMIDEVREQDDSGSTVLYAVSKLRLQELPRQGSEAVWMIPEGMPVEVVEEEGEWSSLRVKDYASGLLRVGWAASDHLVEWEELTLESAPRQHIEPDG